MMSLKEKSWRFFLPFQGDFWKYLYIGKLLIMYRIIIYTEIANSFRGDFDFLLKSGTFWKIFWYLWSKYECFLMSGCQDMDF